jgi:hypothetical protein
LKSCIRCKTGNPIYIKSSKNNCWDYLKCPKEIKQKCESYKIDLGTECWLVSEEVETGCYGYKKYNSCLKCPFYKIKNLKTISEFDI